MAVTIIWSPQAEKDFDQITDYLLDKWSEDIAVKFIRIAFDKIELISKFPRIYAASQFKQGVRRCVINKHVSLYYRELEGRIELLSFRSNRMDQEGIDF